MARNGETSWTDLLVDARVTPPALDEVRYREWMRGRPIFVSSVMDAQMEPDRATVRRYLESVGATPVMWEAITPLDAHPQDAYLAGVDRSDVFVLLVGARYGRSDASGYSPTHQEGNRAATRGIVRLLFERADVAPSERDGRLNDWIGSLYNELAGARYTSPPDLVAQLDARLREIAAAGEAYWIKLGSLVLPGVVRRRSGGGRTEFAITATVRDASVRRAIASLGGWGATVPADRLTWGLETYRVRVERVETHAVGMSVEEVTITCAHGDDQQRAGHRMLMHVGVGGSGRPIGPSDQARQWAARAFFGAGSAAADGRRGSLDLLGSLIAPDGPTLPDVLAATGARGWLAEGLVRLYVVEQFDAKYGGSIDRLEAGPATATGVRVTASMRVERDAAPVDVEGVVRLGGPPR
jgi:hypothetical protein